MHIVFHSEDAKNLSKSFELDDSLKQEVIEIIDDYSIGPIKQLSSEDGIDNRKEWWIIVAGENLDEQANSLPDDDVESIRNIKNQLDNDPDEKIWIWVAANKRDVCGYYRIVSELEAYAGRVMVLHLNNLPFINEKGNIFYPDYLYQIPPKEFLKAKKLARPVTSSEFELDSDEWTRLGNENKSVRILEGAKKLSQYHADYFDESLLNYVTTDWQKASKIVSQFLSRSKISIDELFALWRLNYLIEDQTIEARGDVKNRKEFEIKKLLTQL
ncbi:MAG: DUF1835 domain-containing protein [Ginsengibacter sp.]